MTRKCEVLFSLTTKVERCLDCPFFGTEGGPGPIMVCNHPFWNTKAPYAGCIITQENRTGIPEACPLRKLPVMTEVRIAE